MSRKGAIIVGSIAAATGLGLLLAKVAGAAPPSLVQQLLDRINTATSLAGLESIRVEFTSAKDAGAITYAEYQTLYAAYSTRYDQLTQPPPPVGLATLNISAVKPLAVMPAPRVSVDDVYVGDAPVSVQVSPGTHIISLEDRPGGNNPYNAPGVAYFQAPPPKTVTVSAGQTLNVSGTYTAVLVSTPVFTQQFFFASPPTVPGTHIVYLTINNTSDRRLAFEVFAYNGDPGDPAPPLGSAMVGSLGSFSIDAGIGNYNYPAYLTLPQPGTYSIRLRFYESGVFVKKVNTGVSVTVAYYVPPPPSGLPIETQLASILSNVMQVWVWRAGEWLYYAPVNPEASSLTELKAGDDVRINISYPCTLTYGGRSWNLVGGWNVLFPVIPGQPWVGW